MSRLGLIAIACIACSSSPKPVRAVNVSADRANPHRIELIYRDAQSDSTKIHASAPSAGTWWYVVIAPHPRDSFVSFLFSTPGRVTFALVREDGTRVPATTQRWDSLLYLPEMNDAPERYLLEVKTTAATRFDVSVRYTWREVEPPPEPPVVRPPPPERPPCADLNMPDFNNPRCCEAICTFGNLGCKSTVITVSPHGTVKIGLGKREGIMRYATGFLYQKNQTVSAIQVANVDETESSITIFDRRSVDFATLAENGLVILSEPAACTLRRRQSRP